MTSPGMCCQEALATYGALYVHTGNLFCVYRDKNYI